MFSLHDGHPASMAAAQRFIELDDVAAAAMAELLKSMRGEGAVGTTTLECLRMTPATLRDIQRVNQQSPGFELLLWISDFRICGHGSIAGRNVCAVSRRCSWSCCLWSLPVPSCACRGGRTHHQALALAMRCDPVPTEAEITPCANAGGTNSTVANSVPGLRSV